jgi:hypothetical protein
MKKQFGKLAKAQQEKAELAYHQMKPEDFDDLMANAKRHVPETIRLPKKLVKHLQAVAKAEGEPEYQVMVRRWIEERLQQRATA